MQYARPFNKGVESRSAWPRQWQTTKEARAPPAQAAPEPDWRLAEQRRRKQKHENEGYSALPTYLPRLASLALSLIVAGNQAEAAYIINISQVGSDVVATGSGSINAAALTKGSSAIPANPTVLPFEFTRTNLWVGSPFTRATFQLSPSAAAPTRPTHHLVQARLGWFRRWF
jgi:hypothetical protein